MQRFARLRQAGASTVGERLALLREHQTGLRERIRALRANSRALDEKINDYEQILEQQ